LDFRSRSMRETSTFLSPVERRSLSLSSSPPPNRASSSPPPLSWLRSWRARSCGVLSSPPPNNASDSAATRVIRITVLGDGSGSLARLRPTEGIGLRAAASAAAHELLHGLGSDQPQHHFHDRVPKQPTEASLGGRRASSAGCARHTTAAKQ